ncbi:hypothetical protein CRE_23465 [Caenorhabditis remanei]|uniref:Uncharacterized protein n=1 Tax=Caenorhabditis remanei TaxID=31234 RepID=E3MGV5_CAERE|nr:hypothetical protein CRE_23465 [Caenorhabditis remanei]
MSCNQEVSLLENPTFFRNLCFLLTVSEVAVTSLTLYLLVFHSPSQMKEMKWYLINMACWTRAMDLMYSLFVIPYFFIPTLVVLPVGVFSLIGVPTQIQLVMLVIIITGLGSAIVMIFENRFNAIAPPNFRFKIHWRKSFHSVMFLISFSLLISSFLKLEDQKTAKNAYSEYFLCPIPQFFTTAFSFKPVSVPLLITTVLLFSLLILVQVITFACLSFYFLFSLEKSKMSQATRNLQKKFFLTAWLQILTHLAVIVMPMGYTFFSFLLRYRNQSKFKIVFPKEELYFSSRQSIHNINHISWDHYFYFNNFHQPSIQKSCQIVDVSKEISKPKKQHKLECFNSFF